jgi:hypothetical protein
VGYPRPHTHHHQQQQQQAGSHESCIAELRLDSYARIKQLWRCLHAARVSRKAGQLVGSNSEGEG